MCKSGVTKSRKPLNRVSLNRGMTVPSETLTSLNVAFKMTARDLKLEKLSSSDKLFPKDGNVPRVKSFRSISNQVTPSSLTERSLVPKSLIRNQDQENDLKSFSDAIIFDARQEQVHVCSNHPCNYGICVPNTSTFSCYCHNGYTGVDCSVNYNECLISPCLNGATCIDGDAAYFCACSAGFSGVNCEININDCSPNPCLHGGTCVDSVNSYKCFCPKGYFGTNCEIMDMKRDNDICTNYCRHGSCFKRLVNDPKSLFHKSYEIFCTCIPGFTGSRCEINVNECANHPCMNGGSCFDYIDHYHCSCPLGE